jgi:hypothetical protein
MRLVLNVIFVSVLLALFSSEAGAAKTRSCDAKFRVDLNARGPFPVMGNYVMERYSASGRSSTANAARRAARANVRQCGGITWQERWQTVPRPEQPGYPFVDNSYIYPQCKSGNRVSHFDLGNIKCAIHDAVCYMKYVQGRPPGKEYATIWLSTSGQTGSCGSVHLYSSNYGVTCSDTERLKVCGNLRMQYPE